MCESLSRLAGCRGLVSAACVAFVVGIVLLLLCACLNDLPVWLCPDVRPRPCGSCGSRPAPPLAGLADRDAARGVLPPPGGRQPGLAHLVRVRVRVHVRASLDALRTPSLPPGPLPSGLLSTTSTPALSAPLSPHPKGAASSPSSCTAAPTPPTPPTRRATAPPSCWHVRLKRLRRWRPRCCRPPPTPTRDARPCPSRSCWQLHERHTSTRCRRGPGQHSVQVKLCPCLAYKSMQIS